MQFHVLLLKGTSSNFFHFLASRENYFKVLSNTEISHLCEANYVILMTKLKIQGKNTRDGPDWSRGREQDKTRQHNLSEKCLSKYVMALLTPLNSRYSLSFYSA